MEKLKPSHTADENVKTVQLLFLEKLKTRLVKLHNDNSTCLHSGDHRFHRHIIATTTKRS